MFNFSTTQRKAAKRSKEIYNNIKFRRQNHKVLKF